MTSFVILNIRIFINMDPIDANASKDIHTTAFGQIVMVRMKIPMVTHPRAPMPVVSACRAN